MFTLDVDSNSKFPSFISRNWNLVGWIVVGYLQIQKDIPKMDDDVRMGEHAGDADAAGPSIEPAPGGLNLDTRSV